MATTIFLVNPQTFPSSTSYLLDTYTAAAAYSLRQLKTGVTNVVRVRRSSDNAESDFTADEITDGTLTTWTGANNGFVTTIYDQSGNGNNFTQGTASNQPKIVSSGSVITKGSLPTLDLDGTNDSMSRVSITAIESYPFSIFSVASNEGNTTTGNVLLAQRLTSTSGDQSGILVNTDRRTNRSGTFIDYGATTNAYQYLVQENNSDQRLQVFTIDSSSNGEMWLNGTSQDSATISAYSTTPNTSAYLGRNPISSAVSDMNFQELIIFGTDESANRTDIEDDINTHYSIY